MTEPAAPLARSFLERWRGDAGAVDRVRLDAALHERIGRARESWPELDVDVAAFAACVGERTPAGDDALVELRALRVDELYLCFACARGEPTAVRALEAGFLARVPVYLASMRPTAQLIEATQQDLRTRLLVAAPGAAPKIAQYAGVGSLDGWVRVAAIRIALDLVQAENRRSAKVVDHDPAADFIAPGADLELDFIKARYRDEFESSFREALAALPARDRNLLRFTFVESLTPGRIAALYKVHRTTVMRWLQAAEKALLADLRARLIARLQVSEAECDSFIAALQSRLSLTLSSLMPPVSS